MSYHRIISAGYNFLYFITNWIFVFTLSGWWFWTCFICCWSNWSHSKLAGMLDNQITHFVFLVVIILFLY